MSSPARAYWEFLREILRAMKDNDELDDVLLASNPRKAPSGPLPGKGGDRRGASLWPGSEPESEPDEELADVGPVDWEGRYRIEAWVSDLGGDLSRDLVAGTDERPGVLDLGSRIRDVIGYNLAQVDTCSWSWASITYPEDDEYPRIRVRMILRVRQAVPPFNRAGGSFPPPTVPDVSTLTLAELLDTAISATPSGRFLKHNGTKWADVALALADLVTPTADGKILAGIAGVFAEAPGVKVTTGPAPFNLPMLSSDPVDVGPGDLWIVNDGAVRIRYKRPDNGQLLQITFTVA